MYCQHKSIVFVTGLNWHPFRATVDGLRHEGAPRLREIADEEGKQIPAICPRILLRITDTDLSDYTRVAATRVPYYEDSRRHAPTSSTRKIEGQALASQKLEIFVRSSQSTNQRRALHSELRNQLGIYLVLASNGE